MNKRRLRLGPIELLLAGGDVRYVRLGEVEVLRRIYVAVRDASWGTVPGDIENLAIHESDGGFTVSYRCTHRRGEVAFEWDAEIRGVVRTSGDAFDATVRFAMDGSAESAFETNRTGFCVLHPVLECKGRPVTILHSSGDEEKTAFPELIAPHQPFFDVAAMRHAPIGGVEAEVRFEGEVFETEDQRNWTDGSYKTYCRPLAKGFPYELKAGERVRQVVELRVWGKTPAARERRKLIRVGEAARKLPALGLGRSGSTTHRQRELIEAMQLDHERVGTPELGQQLDQQADLAAANGRAVRVTVCPLRRPMATPDDVAAVAADHTAAVVGGGTRGNFTELNRNRPPAGSMKLVGYPINPQVHATDDLSLIENLQGQWDTVRTARSFVGDAHIAVGPIVLHREADRFAAGKSGEGEAEVVGDPRQRTSFAAAWTVGSIKQLAEAGADSLTYYETTGPRGVMEGDEVFPVYHVLKSVCEMKGGEVVETRSSDPLAFEALAVRKGGRLRVMVACLRDEAVEVTLEGVPGGGRVVKLGAYEVAVVDLAG